MSTSTVTWHITRTDKHGIQKFGMGKGTHDFLCAPRSSATAPCQLTVKASSPFTLNVIVNGTEQRKKIQSGEQTFTV